MRKGKMIAQGAHASMGALLSLFTKTKCEYLPPMIQDKYLIDMN
jgi:peptidyl-tRNA hydrolase